MESIKDQSIADRKTRSMEARTVQYIAFLPARQAVRPPASPHAEFCIPPHADAEKRPIPHFVKRDIGEGVKEATLEVGHHRGRVAAQGQDLQQRGVGHKVEARELRALGLCRQQMGKGSGRNCAVARP